MWPILASSEKKIGSDFEKQNVADYFFFYFPVLTTLVSLSLFPSLSLSSSLSLFLSLSPVRCVFPACRLRLLHRRCRRRSLWTCTCHRDCRCRAGEGETTTVSLFFLTFALFHAMWQPCWPAGGTPIRAGSRLRCSRRRSWTARRRSARTPQRAGGATWRCWNWTWSGSFFSSSLCGVATFSMLIYYVLHIWCKCDMACGLSLFF